MTRTRLPPSYHPTHIGDQYLHGRYEVVHKLGFGSHSTVWLAKDYQQTRYVALKVLDAASSENHSESKILRHLRSGKVDHPGRAYVSSLLDEFTIDGPNGRHLCIVSEAAGCSIAQSKDASLTWMFPVNVARAITAQLLMGLDYIHSSGVVHGDLHSNNILFRAPSLKWSTTEELYHSLGEPRRFPVERLDKRSNGPEAPKYCVPPAMIFQSSENVTDARVLISDFGEAFFENEERKDLCTPILILAPELFFHERLGRAIDVWSLGCTLYEVLDERTLFEGFMPDQDHMIAEMISALGDLPQRWWDQWQLKTDFFLEDGSWKKDTHRIRAPYSPPLTERLRIMGRGRDAATCEFSPREMAALEGLLRAMLTYEPAERIGTKAALKSEWMEKWGRQAMSETGISPMFD
ncbi:SR protein-specific kinase Dsk1 [Aspergillus sclerotioniger CBS 115572]|uniref:non-specific serine/threonine protein kinase n=1 Tax=Aspergillus sclerotioniger CBS 115572 TaxID=1450535 RepID=A0A317XAM2_9EURO|nr:SR protein-specific kinase Dsk1 [Aspergillus sclerotioniger CBS 115572]PWY94617.1 SR protein-specific kinase Dsk1 [Aspergillus sclerotioniger CBS 115572]